MQTNGPLFVPAEPLDSAFEGVILAIYRQWYALNPAAGRRALQRLRMDMARQLSVPEAPIESLFESWAADLRTVPGLEDLVAQELLVLDASLRVEIFPPPSPDQISALVELLSAPEPAVTAIGRMLYIDAPGYVEETWNAIYGQLQVAKEGWPATAWSAIEALLDTIPGAPQSEPGAPFDPLRTRAMLEALGQLETMPEVLRIAWRAFLTGKVNDAEALSRWRERNSTLGGNQSFTFFEEAAETAETAGMTSESLVADLPESIVRPLHTYVEFPNQVQTGSQNYLTVQLTLERREDSVLDGSVEMRFQREIEQVQVMVTAAGFDEVYNSWTRTIDVYPDRDSQPAIFLLQADSRVGMRRISVEFRHEGHYIGGGSFDVAVATSGKSARGQRRALGEMHIQELGSLNPDWLPADLELRITQGADERDLHFVLHSTRTEVGYHWISMGTTRLSVESPHVLADRIFARLSELAATPIDLDAGEVDQVMNELGAIGEELYEIFPLALREEFDQRILRLVEDGKVSSLLITSDEPWIPWEMVRPYRYDRYTDEMTPDNFLAESFAVTRWLPGRFGPHFETHISDGALIVPESGLIHTGEEEEYVRALGAEGVQIGEPIGTRADVLKLMQDGTAQLIHFAAHAGFDPDNPLDYGKPAKHLLRFILTDSK